MTKAGKNPESLNAGAVVETTEQDQPKRSGRQVTETRFWLQLLGVQALVYNDLNKALIDAAGIGISKYEVLAHLDRFPDGLSMGEISSKLKVSNGNVSGLVNRLCAAGLIVRKNSAEDRRSYIAIMTPEGRNVFEAATEAHSRELSRKFRSISPDLLEQAMQNLQAMSSEIRSDDQTR